MNRDKLLVKYFAENFPECYPHRERLRIVGESLGFAFYVLKFRVRHLMWACKNFFSK